MSQAEPNYRSLYVGLTIAFALVAFTQFAFQVEWWMYGATSVLGLVATYTTYKRERIVEAQTA